jgi:CheY-like chemotaxis protein
VLVVDDEVAVGNTLKLVLQSEHDVELATSAHDALELLSKGDFDAVVCDLMMPGMTGLDLHETVRQSYPWLEERMVFMTGGALMSDSEGFLSRLKNPLLEKPFDIALIRETLRRLVAAAKDDPRAG